MARSQDSFNKKEKEKKRLKKRQDKQNKKDERKTSDGDSSFESMLAYVDENGNITDTPPDPAKKTKIDVESIAISVPKKEDEEYDPIRRGRVEYFNDQKGYGFIKEIETQEKYFVHINGLIDDVREGEMVTFELERGLKGMNAIGVKKSK